MVWTVWVLCTHNAKVKAWENLLLLPLSSWHGSSTAPRAELQNGVCVPESHTIQYNIIQYNNDRYTPYIVYIWLNNCTVRQQLNASAWASMEFLRTASCFLSTLLSHAQFLLPPSSTFVCFCSPTCSLSHAFLRCKQPLPQAPLAMACSMLKASHILFTA